MPYEPQLEQEQTTDQRPPGEVTTVGATLAYQEAGTTVPDRVIPPQQDDWPVIEGYVILRVLAQGGMGRVYAAYDKTLDREVAIKVMLPGSAVLRFVTESKITARLPHPGIPPVYELGSLPDGSQYLVMKLVGGQTLAALLKERATPGEGLSRWLQVFEQIAQAVGYAHSQGIIHRDLKPANVMVGAFGEVQVMDWGLAKVLASRETESEKPVEGGATVEAEDALQTSIGTIMGTPAYMPPEQAKGEVVGPPADVFSLGGILVTMLTGQATFTGATMLKTIELAAAGATEDAISRLDQCGADPELIAIARRCLAVNPLERWQDAKQLTDAVVRYRGGVEARLHQAEADKAAALARSQEQQKRRRALLWAAGIITAVLVVGIIGTALGLVEAKQQEQFAKKETEAKELARQAEAEQKNRALEAAAAEKIANEELKKHQNLLFSVFEDLDVNTIRAGKEPVEVILAGRLIELGKKLDASTARDPEAIAHLQNRLAISLRNLGHAREAVPLLLQALQTYTRLFGEDDARVLSTQSNLGEIYRYLGQYDQAVPLFLKTLQAQKALHGTMHGNTISTMNNLAVAYSDIGEYEKAYPLYEELLAIQRSIVGSEHVDTLRTMNNLGAAYLMAGNVDKSMELHQEAWRTSSRRLGDDHPLTLYCLSNIAEAHRTLAEFDKALPLFETAWKGRKAKLGSTHPETLQSMMCVAATYGDLKRYEQAIALQEETLALMKQKLDPAHPDILQCMAFLAESYQFHGQAPQAVELLKEVLKSYRARYGDRHLLTLRITNNLASALKAAGAVEQAVPLLEEALPKSKSRLGPVHHLTLMIGNNLGQAYSTQGKLDKAIPVLEESLKGLKKAKGDDDPETLGCMSNLAEAYRVMGRFDKALPLLQGAYPRMKVRLGIDNPKTLAVMITLAAGYYSSAQLQKAIPLNEEALKLAKARLGPDHQLTRQAMANMGVMYQAAGKLDKAIPLQEEAVQAMKAKLPPDHPDLLASMNSLGVTYFSAQQYDKSVAILEESLKLAKVKLGPDHYITLAMMNNLARSYLLSHKEEQSLKVFEQIIQLERKKMGATTPAFAGLLATTSLELLSNKQYAAAEPYLRECLALREKHAPDDWQTFYTLSMLGGSLVGQKKYQEAEPLLLKGYEGMKLREKTIPPQGIAKLSDALDLLLAYYTLTGNAEELKKWQGKKGAR